MADIGREGWIKLGSLIPWPGSLALTVEWNIETSASFLSSGLKSERKIERKSVSVIANKHDRS